MIYASKLDWIEAQEFEGDDQLIFLDGSGETIATFGIPGGLLRRFITAHAKSQAGVSLDGTIAAMVDDDLDLADTAPIAIDDLVARDLAPEMLEDEPNALAALQEFERRLNRALGIVTAAIKQLQPR